MRFRMALPIELANMLNNTLNTNEVKDRAGAEIELERRSTGPGQITEFKKLSETAGLPVRLSIKHETSGTGIKETRRSVVEAINTVENSDGEKVTSIARFSVVHPSGLADDFNGLKDAIAMILSFCATTGAGTTVLLDGSGSGANALINEGL
jgi:hypothetical protein